MPTDQQLRREFSEYCKLAKLRIAPIPNGHEQAYQQYLIERRTPTPLMLQAAEKAQTNKE